MPKNNNTLSSKLTSLIWLTSGSALLVASIGITLYEFVSYQKLLLNDLSTKAELIGQSASAALHFADEAAADDIVSIFQADSAVLFASLHGRSGRQLAAYRSDQSDSSFPQTLDLGARSQQIDWLYVDFSQPIFYEQETVGGLFIRQSLMPFYARQLRHLMILALVLLLASIVIGIISPRLKKEITLPILKLTETSRAISESKDYTMRVSQQLSAGNEITVLANAFNDMLIQIEQRDKSLADYRDHLEELVSEQTAYLYQNNLDLQHAMEQAEEASRFKSIILDNVTHEFRTPLNGILGITALLRDESAIDLEELIEMIDLIDESSYRLLGLLTSLLNLASLEKDVLTYSGSPLPIDVALDDLLPPFHELAQEKGLSFEINISRIHHPVPLDTRVFEMLLEPLLSNAFKFTTSGYVALTIYTDLHDLKISVHDTGKGIAPSFIKDMFTPFSQESSGLTRSHEGAGIGLAIVKRIADQFCGTIDVQSEVGTGTTIEVSLTLAQLNQGFPSIHSAQAHDTLLHSDVVNV